METRIGFIGTGIMGQPMARNLLKAGFRLTVHSRTRSKSETLLDQGAEWADSPAEVAERSNIIMTMLGDSPDVEKVYLGDLGIASKVRPGALCVDMSTVSPATAQAVGRRLQARNADFLDAPVSGGKTGAEAAALVIMVGGDPAVLEKARPVLSVLGKSIVHCGPWGYGQLTKLCNQILCGLNLLAVGEAIIFARWAGLDPQIMLQAVSGGAAGSWALQNLGPRMLSGDFAPMFMIDLQQKDLRIAMEIARSQALPLPGTALVQQLLASNQSHGEGREGTQALIKTLERLAALTSEPRTLSQRSEESPRRQP